MLTIRPSLRIRWAACNVGDYVVGDRPDVKRLWQDAETCRADHDKWWETARHSLPGCRRPGPPYPVLIDDDGIVVGVLSPVALHERKPPTLTIINGGASD